MFIYMHVISVLLLSHNVCAAVTKEAHLKKHDNMTPVKMLPNMATHLSGPSRTVGAAIVGNSGLSVVDYFRLSRCTCIKSQFWFP